MKLRFIAAAVIIACGIAGGTVANELTASASSFNCDPGAGCATLHSVDSEGTAATIAVDAKRQSTANGTLVIGYPDLAQDKATSFDKVLHYYNTPYGQDPAAGAAPYYTLVYAPNGNWTNQCLTADTTTGKIALEPCTLGHDAYQRFKAYVYTPPTTTTDGSTVTSVSYKLSAAPVVITDFTSKVQYVLANDGTFGYLEDSSKASPTVPQPDASDSRQLDANGSLAGTASSVPANLLWTWNS